MIFVRQDSDSGSEGSDSSQSESESDDDGNNQHEAQRQLPPLSHYHAAMQLSSPGEIQHAFNNNPTTPTQKKKFEERVCLKLIYSLKSIEGAPTVLKSVCFEEVSALEGHMCLYVAGKC